MNKDFLTPDEQHYADRDGLPREVPPFSDYDENGYDQEGYDFDGYTVEGIHRDGHYDPRHDEVERRERASVYLDPYED